MKQKQKLINSWSNCVYPNLVRSLLFIFINVLTVFCLPGQNNTPGPVNNLNCIFGELSRDKFDAGDYNSAIYYAEKSLKKDSSNILSWVYLIASYYQMEDFDNAINTGLLALNTDIKDANIYKFIGWSYVAKNLHREGLNYLNIAIPMDSTGYLNYYFRALAHIGLKDFSSAEKDSKKALQIDNSVWILNSLHGFVLYNLGKYKEANKFLDASLKIDPEKKAPFYYKGMIEFYMANYPEAISYYETALSGNLDVEEYVNAHYYKGMSHYILEEFEQSSTMMMKLLEIDSTNTLVILRLGESQIHLGQYDLAKQTLKRGGLQNKDGAYNLAFAQIFYLQNDYEQSTSELLMAQKLGTNFDDKINFYGRMAQHWFMLGDTTNALSALDFLKDSLPENPGVYTLRLRMFYGNASQFSSHIHEDINSLISLYKKYGKNEFAAYYYSVLSVFYFSNGEIERSLQTIDRAIELDRFSEYFAFRAFLNYTIISSDKIFTNDSSSQKVLDREKVYQEIMNDLDTALSSNWRKKDVLLLQATVFIVFEEDKLACEAINNAKSLGAEVSKEHYNLFCSPKRFRKNTTVEWDFMFELSSFDELLKRQNL